MGYGIKMRNCLSLCPTGYFLKWRLTVLQRLYHCTVYGHSGQLFYIHCRAVPIFWTSPLAGLCFLPLSDVAVQLPDKKSIIMYLTSLFEVLPQQVTIDAVREVETLPRKYKKECEEGDINMQVQVHFHWNVGLAILVLS